MVFKKPLGQPGQQSQSLAVVRFVFAGMVLAACLAQPKSAQAQSGLAASKASSLPSSMQLGDQARAPILLDRVVAVVNNDVIVESELRRRLDQVRRNLSRSGQPLPPDQVLRDQVLDRMTTDLALLQRALEAGLQVDNPSLDRAIARLAESNGLTVSALREQLRTEGVSFDAFREDIRDEITISRLRERDVENRLRISDSEIDAFV